MRRGAFSGGRRCFSARWSWLQATGRKQLVGAGARSQKSVSDRSQLFSSRESVLSKAARGQECVCCDDSALVSSWKAEGSRREKKDCGWERKLKFCCRWIRSQGGASAVLGSCVSDDVK